ncbi:hypothetical protein J6590_060208 [Homalodisca vitripennis]|nr:hypothetical protein J6590_060208 [Homalodisca vitripennis]
MAANVTARCDLGRYVAIRSVRVDLSAAAYAICYDAPVVSARFRPVIGPPFQYNLRCKPVNSLHYPVKSVAIRSVRVDLSAAAYAICYDAPVVSAR